MAALELPTIRQRRKVMSPVSTSSRSFSVGELSGSTSTPEAGECAP
jgi:hypothetical protein